jgi:BlaI family transcriptional regulator, penicillinase repressor
MGRRPSRAAPHKAVLTPLETEVLQALWDGACTVQEARVRLPRDLAYNTVQTVLNLLVRKGSVTRTRSSRAFAYRPSVSRLDVAKRATRELLDRLFGGSSEELVLSLVETRELTAAALARLHAKVNAKGRRS